MPAVYKVYGGKYDGQYGSLVGLEKDKATIKLDSGEIITDPPEHAYYQGQITQSQAKMRLNKKGGKGK